MAETARGNSPVASAFASRASRARELAKAGGPARAALAFAAALFEAQGIASARLEEEASGRGLRGRLEGDAWAVLACRRALFAAIAAAAPAGGEVAEEAEERSEEDEETASARLLVYWSGETEAQYDYLSRALLRPYVEVLAKRGVETDRRPLPGHCPFCGGRPGLAVRRELPETNGATRFLACALCGGEWPVGRIRCPACEEENPEKLPVFHDDRHPLARVEACETCRRYVKSLDLSLDARPIPEVDELLSISLDLWAAENGYARLEPGIAGL
ncbi:MAG TPA: formate dehydrogenase accessory protein FdhE [Thermoanaerobaculia bacterium]|nr:formate dehydrogenase accessory protein FdhE [Thermoanaerobaculia bacterium]